MCALVSQFGLTKGAKSIESAPSRRFGHWTIAVARGFPFQFSFERVHKHRSNNLMLHNSLYNSTCLHNMPDNVLLVMYFTCAQI